MAKIHDLLSTAIAKMSTLTSEEPGFNKGVDACLALLEEVKEEVTSKIRKPYMTSAWDTNHNELMRALASRASAPGTATTGAVWHRVGTPLTDTGRAWHTVDTTTGLYEGYVDRTGVGLAERFTTVTNPIGVDFDGDTIATYTTDQR